MVVTLVIPQETYELFEAAGKDPRKLMEEVLKEQAPKVYLQRQTPQETDSF